ncbi:MAG TPA: TetR/AcrR family transcriptional regulator [Sporichthya sp.]|nr:TetR/AcrR family transcriptional regulator [Sporichthya sp.]
MDLPLPPGRTPPKRGQMRIPITQDAIVDAALRVLDAEGLEAVSMRRVGQELDTGPASLYAHVANKKELLDLVFDRIVGEVELPGPPDPDRWQDQVRELGIAMHATLSSHADVARVALANIPLGPNSLRVAERMLAIMLAGGVGAQDAGWFLDRVSLYICADAYEGTLWELPEGIDPVADHEELVAPLRNYFASLPAEHFPSFVANVDAMTTGGAEERFLFGLDLLLDGLAARTRR